MIETDEMPVKGTRTHPYVAAINTPQLTGQTWKPPLKVVLR